MHIKFNQKDIEGVFKQRFVTVYLLYRATLSFVVITKLYINIIGISRYQTLRQGA